VGGNSTGLRIAFFLCKLLEDQGTPLCGRLRTSRDLFIDPEMACFGVDLTPFVPLSLKGEGEGLE